MRSKMRSALFESLLGIDDLKIKFITCLLGNAKLLTQFVICKQKTFSSGKPNKKFICLQVFVNEMSWPKAKRSSFTKWQTLAFDISHRTYMKTSEFRKQYRAYKKKHSKPAPTPPLEKHSSHQVEIQPVTSWKHHAKYFCLDCKKFVAWVSKKDADTAKELGLL